MACNIPFSHGESECVYNVQYNTSNEELWKLPKFVPMGKWVENYFIAFTCIYLVTNDFEHLFMCFLVILTSFG